MRGAWDEGEEGNYLCLKVILKFSTYFFYFSKQKLYTLGVGGWVGEPSFVGNESDGHKMCFSEPRGLFYILWHEDTEKKPPPGPRRGSLCSSPGCPHPELGLPSSQRRGVCCCLPNLVSHPPGLSPLPFDLALLDKRGAVKGGGLRVGPGFTIYNLWIWVKSSGPQGAS